MRATLLIIFIASILFSCNNHPDNDPDQLIYHTENADGLATQITLTGDKSKNELNAQIKLSPKDNAELLSVTIQTDEGLHCDPLSFISLQLKNGADTTINLKFDPFNNQELYQVTGMRGDLRKAYSLIISYKDGDKVINQNIRSSADKSDYAAYLKQYGKQITAYSFNTAERFNEKEKQYLNSLNITPKTAFVYLSDQEIAVAGLNFRLTNHYLHDTLYADLSIVNHADFQVKIIPDSLDIQVSGSTANGSKIISIEKVSGTQQFLTMIEKGDRAVIHLKKFVKISNPANQKLLLDVGKAFLLKGNKHLFVQNIGLIPHRFN